LIEWLAAPERAAEISAWGFLIGLVGLPFTLIGLMLTYVQARRARISAEQLKNEIEIFQFKRDQSDALSVLGEAKAAMEASARLITADSWRDAVESYDNARKCIQKVRLVCTSLNSRSQRKLKLISDHLTAFATQVEAALVSKDEFPDSIAVTSTIRKHSDEITVIQHEIQEAIK
jgi:hypothetical protein